MPSWYFVVLFLELCNYTKILYLSCVDVVWKKNEYNNNIANEQEENALLKSSPAISLEVKRLTEISDELEGAQSEETKELIGQYKYYIKKIISSLKININII